MPTTTAAEAVRHLQAIKQSEGTCVYDPVLAHQRADKILCEFIRALGFNDVADAFMAIRRSYL